MSGGAPRCITEADGASTIVGLRPTLYVNVPGEVVLATIEKHAGMIAGQIPELAAEEVAYDASADDTVSEDALAAPTSVIHLGAPPPPPPASAPPPASPTPPHMEGSVRYASDGYAWAAACEPPSESGTSYDSNGCAWAAACEPPDDTPSTLTFDTSTGVMMGSPLSPTMMMDMMTDVMTAFPTAFGQLAPPPALLHTALSPIQTTNHLMIEDKKEEDHS